MGLVIACSVLFVVAQAMKLQGKQAERKRVSQLPPTKFTVGADGGIQDDDPERQVRSLDQLNFRILERIEEMEHTLHSKLETAILNNKWEASSMSISAPGHTEIENDTAIIEAELRR